MSDWNDIRYVLEVWRTGSTLAAGRTLKVSQSTVMRRIAALERELAVELFDKRRTGYAATATLTALLPRLQAAEAAHLAFEHEADAISRDISGAVTVTAAELVCSIFLNQAIAELRRMHPAIRIELMASGRMLDLAAGEADIAIRAGGRPTDNGLFGRRLAEETWNFYCSSSYARAHGVPRSIADLAGHSVLAPQDKSFSPQVTGWFRQHIPDSVIVVRHTGLAPVYYSVKSGVGVSVLSDFLTAGDADLIHCFTPPEFSRNEVWLLTHERHRQTARVRAVMGFLGRYFDGLRQRGMAEAVSAGTGPDQVAELSSLDSPADPEITDVAVP
ncbi:transcriptional regulator [Hoeflea sp. IMCC20628]|uniref:LysR family transcriptional regulator n=1 Tax=Hoeflea sp. IMCC20628 TaxID=1620421 RepID=UPI00063BE8FE|nr:LysR family transcriptional regulator [Hoeflea sp. IMCC20628]AKI00315.1 transcriptional regulator [Hoeflea sp. IMCC20628]